MSERQHKSLAKVNPRPRTIYCSQGRAVLATDLDGLIADFPRHVLFVGETRVLSPARNRLCECDESDVPIAAQHTRLDSRQEPNALLTTIAYPASE